MVGAAIALNFGGIARRYKRNAKSGDGKELGSDSATDRPTILECDTLCRMAKLQDR
jgi:hypothetical protein